MQNIIYTTNIKELTQLGHLPKSVAKDFGFFENSFRWTAQILHSFWEFHLAPTPGFQLQFMV